MYPVQRPFAGRGILASALLATIGLSLKGWCLVEHLGMFEAQPDNPWSLLVEGTEISGPSQHILTCMSHACNMMKPAGCHDIMLAFTSLRESSPTLVSWGTNSLWATHLTRPCAAAALLKMFVTRCWLCTEKKCDWHDRNDTPICYVLLHRYVIRQDCINAALSRGHFIYPFHCQVGHQQQKHVEHICMLTAM